VGIEGVEILSPWQNKGSDGVERESAQDEHDRQSAEKAAAIRERQIRLGHIPNPEDEQSPENQE
jgi:hypothetical protein